MQEAIASLVSDSWRKYIVLNSILPANLSYNSRAIIKNYNNCLFAQCSRYCL
jgi:hypothetical protein